ncbi:MAG: hypothetical protein AAGG48_00610 [Planctomycetota bacterium]
MNEPDPSVDEGWLFPRLWAVANVFLIALTWRLWFPPLNGTYPNVSLLGPSLIIPVWVGWIASGGVLCGLTAIALQRGRRNLFWWIVVTASVLGFCIDQHRLQPWAYQTAIYAVIFATLPRRECQRCLIIIASSVYLFSALGKFDFQFLHTVGQDFLQTLAKPIGGLPDDWTLQTRTRCALIFPITECMIGLGLLIPKTRHICAIAVMAMHATLLGVLGPWGLNHSLGVLGWNLLLFLQAYFLFFQSRSELDQWKQPQASKEVGSRLANHFCAVLVAFVVIAPLTERRGYWDHWLSWSLYSPHTSRVELQLHQTVLANLPDQLQRFTDSDPDGDGWHQLYLGDWSLDTRGVPVYPQARYQLGLSIRLLDALDQAKSEDGIRGRIRSASDRWSGKRADTQLSGLQQLQETGNKRYWLWP